MIISTRSECTQTQHNSIKVQFYTQISRSSKLPPIVQIITAPRAKNSARTRASRHLGKKITLAQYTYHYAIIIMIVVCAAQSDWFDLMELITLIAWLLVQALNWNLRCKCQHCSLIDQIERCRLSTVRIWCDAKNKTNQNHLSVSTISCRRSALYITNSLSKPGCRIV